MIIEEMVDKVCRQLKIKRSEYRFNRRRIREYCGWGNTQLKLHLKRLEEMEYLIVHRGCRGQSYEYELLYDGNGKDGSTFLMGLIDVKRLRKKGDYEEKKSGVNGELSGLEEKKSVPGRPLVGGWSGGGRVGQKALNKSDLPSLAAKMGKNAHIGLKENETSTIRLEA
jgi:hypothetical protein